MAITFPQQCTLPQRDCHASLAMTDQMTQVRVSCQGLFKVPDDGPSPRTVFPAKAGIQSILSTATSEIPAFVGMTRQL